MRILLKGLMALIATLILPSYAYAQASIAGVVRDTSGGVLPGVTVEASSPALIEKVRTAVTDGTGQYRIVDLRPGTYSITFTLPGFVTVKRDGIVLEGFFAATVNVDMPVGALEETITVTGEAPIVDVQSVRRNQVFNADTFAAIPTGRGFQNLAALIPGLVLSQTQDVGVGLSTVTDMTINGSFVGDGRLLVGNMSVAAPARQGATATHYQIDVGSAQETVITTSGGLGEAETGGVVLNVIPREGGNVFRGSFFGTFANSSFQANNLTPALRAAGLPAPNRLKNTYDVNLSLGGPIVRDRVWFFASWRPNGVSNYIAGMYPNKNANNPNSWVYEADLSRQAVSDAEYQSRAARLTFQVTPRNKVNVFWDEQYRCTSCTAGGSATSAPEANSQGKEPVNRVFQGYWTAPITSRLMLEAGEGSFINPWGGRAYRDTVLGIIPVTEQCTNGCVNQIGTQIPNLTYRAATYAKNYDATVETRGSASYVTGAHSMKVGFRNYFAVGNRGVASISPVLSYRFNNGVPNRLTMNAGTRERRARVNSFGLYVQDQWKINRWTLQGGVRWDHATSWFPQAQLGPTRFIPDPIIIPEADGVDFHDITPRLGVAYDVFGTGRTAIKANLSKFPLAVDGGSELGTNFAPLNRMTLSVDRSWNDANRNYNPDCNLLNPRANGECGQISDLKFGTTTPSNRYDPAITGGWGTRPYNWVTSVSVEQQLGARLAATVGYNRRWYGNFGVTDNTAQTPTDYTLFNLTVPSDSRLPNAGAVLTGIANVNSQGLLSSVDNLITEASNYGRQSQVFNGIDLSLSARGVNGLVFQGGYNIGRTVFDQCEVQAKVPEMTTVPLGYCRNGVFQYQVKLLTSYTVPRIGVEIGATFQSLSGPALQANYTVNNAIASASSTLGRPLVASGNSITVPLLPPNTHYGDRINQLDVRFSKLIRIGPTRNRLNLDLFNALNSSMVQTYNSAFTPGGAWNRPTLILSGRLVKISGQIDF